MQDKRTMSWSVCSKAGREGTRTEEWTVLPDLPDVPDRFVEASCGNPKCDDYRATPR